ncbi:helix-turn-helix domain-containing protein [Mucilaginibacter ginkgonis]|uniref:Helix-turn-helix transcriptional regulator n=1 Tax=Mucilaginibacter ginkgonis TaxID=2682091 RepID=A0A7T7FBC8_9SPHI|nr:AraC family transcriptional regulator [Mucilaginibacter ginkgonis]QQL50119.1 helix-turn-helix transcriptional regulator [Mucilaginibacter ginkgonis]
MNDLVKDYHLSLVQEQLLESSGDVQRLACIEQFLLTNMTGREADKLVEAAIDLIDNSQGTIRIEAMARQLNTSLSPLEKRFRAIVGTTPKKYATIVRMKRMLQALEINDKQKADYLLDFYDQSHFIHQFKKFTSLTPQQYYKQYRKAD